MYKGIAFNEIIRRLTQNDPTLTYVDFRFRLPWASRRRQFLKAMKNNSCVQYLILAGNFVSVKMVKLLMKKPAIIFLNLSYTRLPHAAAKFIAKNKTLEALDLSGNNWGDKPIQLIAKRNKTLKQLKLDLINMTDVGALALAKNKTLQELSINYNKIGNVGAKAFVDAKRSALIALSVNGNLISKEIALLFIHKNFLLSLEISNNLFGEEVLLEIDHAIERNKKNIFSIRQKIFLEKLRILFVNRFNPVPRIYSYFHRIPREIFIELLQWIYFGTLSDAIDKTPLQITALIVFLSKQPWSVFVAENQPKPLRIIETRTLTADDLWVSHFRFFTTSTPVTSPVSSSCQSTLTGQMIHSITH